MQSTYTVFAHVLQQVRIIITIVMIVMIVKIMMILMIVKIMMILMIVMVIMIVLIIMIIIIKSMMMIIFIKGDWFGQWRPPAFASLASIPPPRQAGHCYQVAKRPFSPSPQKRRNFLTIWQFCKF